MWNRPLPLSVSLANSFAWPRKGIDRRYWLSKVHVYLVFGVEWKLWSNLIATGRWSPLILPLCIHLFSHSSLSARKSSGWLKIDCHGWQKPGCSCLIIRSINDLALCPWSFLVWLIFVSKDVSVDRYLLYATIWMPRIFGRIPLASWSAQVLNQNLFLTRRRQHSNMPTIWLCFFGS